MLIKNYESLGLLCNVSVNGPTTTAGQYAFRGDLVLEEGEIADASGRRMPPKSVIKQAIVLTRDDKLVLVAGALDELETLPLFNERYRKDFAPGIKVFFYVENLGKALVVGLDEVPCILVPHDDGAVWNTLMDDMRLEKDDFKGQSAEDKVITMSAAVHDFKPKYDTASFNDALGFIVEVRKQARGPV